MDDSCCLWRRVFAGVCRWCRVARLTGSAASRETRGLAALASRARRSGGALACDAPPRSFAGAGRGGCECGAAAGAPALGAAQAACGSETRAPGGGLAGGEHDGALLRAAGLGSSRRRRRVAAPGRARRPSPRAGPDRREEPGYDAWHAGCRVRTDGVIKWGGDMLFVSEPLATEKTVIHLSGL